MSRYTVSEGRCMWKSFVQGRSMGRNFFWCLCVHALVMSASALLLAGEIPGNILPKIPDDWSFSQTPAHRKDPEEFWVGKKVYPRRGIVVEDEFFIVDGEAKKCWTLDQFTPGTVEAVEEYRGMPVAVVAFEDTELWMEGAVAQIELGVARAAQLLTVERYGEWVDQSVTANPELGGFRVNRQDAGVIVNGTPREPGAVKVRFPIALLSVARPGFGARVKRSADWCFGHSDGGSVGFGLDPNADKDLLGTTLGTVDESGLVEVEWDYTYQRKFVRFGAQDCYDIVEVEPGEVITDPDRVDALRDALAENAMIRSGAGGGNGGGAGGGRQPGGSRSGGGRGGSSRGASSRGEPGGGGSSPMAFGSPRSGSQPPSGSSPQNYGSQPPSGSSPQNYGSQPPSGSSPQNYGSQPPSGSSPQNYGSQPPSGSRPPSGSSPQ
jgi:hypothetical protein